MRKQFVFFLFILVYLIHLIGVLGFISFFELGSGRPLLTDDYSFRSLILYDTRSLFKASGATWGYSPYHLAGVPYAVFSISSKGEQLLSLLFFFLHPAELLKLYIIAVLLIFPFLMRGAAKVLTSNASSASVAGILTILFFWKFPNISLVEWGSVSYLFVFPLALLSLGFLLRFIKNRSFLSLLLFWISGSISYLSHPSVFPVLLPPILAALAIAAQKTSKRTAAFGLLALLGIGATSLSWIIPFLRFRSMFVPISPQAPFSVLDLCTDRDLFPFFILVFALLGIWSSIRSKPELYCPLGIGIMWLMALMFFLTSPGFLLIQRIKYYWPFMLFLTIPASEFIAAKVKDLRKKPIPKFSLILCISLFIGLLTSDPIPFVSSLKNLFLKEKTFASSGSFPTSMTPSGLDALLAWVRDKTDRSGRILMEDSPHPLHVYWGTHLPAILPTLVKREIASSPIPEIPLSYRSTVFNNGVLFQKPIETIPPESFKNYMERYNISWIVCFSAPAKRYFKSLSPYLSQSASIDHFSCYQINRRGNFFLKGSGKVSADFNRISLKEVKPEEGDIILKYHWFPGFRTVPERKIEKEDIEGDPAGFIKIKNPPQEIEIVF